MKRKSNPSDIAPEAYELALYIDNDADLYRQRTLPIIQNLQRKWTKGTYDHAKAVKLWRYLADAGARKYTQEFGSRGGSSYGIFTVAMRNEVARWLANQNLENVEQGYESKTKPRKTNPASPRYSVYIPADGSYLSHRDRTEWTRATALKHAREFKQRFGKETEVLRADESPRKTNPAPFIGTSRPMRRSQITKKPPSKRLVKRRKKNRNQGYFPNPLKVNEWAKYSIYQSSTKGVERVAMSRDKATAEALAALLQHHAKPGVKFSVKAE